MIHSFFRNCMNNFKQLSNVFLVIIFLVISISAGAQTRSVSDIKKMIKGVQYTKNFEFYIMGHSFKNITVPFNFVSLKDVNPSLLNDKEKELLETYTDVAFGFKDDKDKMLHCYWVKTEKGDTGLLKLDGSVLVVPVDGHFYGCPSSDRIVAGEKMLEPEKWFGSYWAALRELDGLPVGLFYNVVDDAKSDKIHTIVKNGEYDGMRLAFKGMSPEFIVAKVVDGNVKWGVIDKKGEVELPAIYRGVYVKKPTLDFSLTNRGGKWIGTDEMNMKEIRKFIGVAKEERRQNAENIYNSVSQVNDAIQQTGNALGYGTGESSGDTQQRISDTSAGGSGNYESQYRNWERRAMQNYESLTINGAKTKKNGKDVSGNTSGQKSPSNYTMQKKMLREAQNEMRKIRSKAAKEGINITKSNYEDVTVDY